MLARCNLQLSKRTIISKKQNILNFIGAHPRLTAILAGLGISIVFSSIGRFFVHEALATTSAAVSSSFIPTPSFDNSVGASTSFQVDYIDKTPISSVPGHVTNVFVPTSCAECAKDFAPGQEATSPGDAQNFAPGELAKSPGDASNFAPGELKKQPT